MFNVDLFYERMGADHPLDADEMLVLNDQVRVMCTEEAVTAVFGKIDTGGEALQTLFEICRAREGSLPFTTRSGQLALRLPSEVTDDETVAALQWLMRAMQQLSVSESAT